MQIRAIREEEREACLDLWCTVWPGENCRTYFSRYFYGDVEWLPYYTRVAVVDGRLVSAVQICKRIVACGDFRLTMGGIANVATLPEYRGRGYNTACLQSAIAMMEADAMDFSLLFTGINDYYARLGYATLPRERMRGRIRADFVPRVTPFAVRAATNADLPAIQALYAQYNQKHPLAVQRYDAYWRDWIGLEPDRMPEPPLLAVDAAGGVVGYLSYRLREDSLVVTEFGRVPATLGAELEIAAALLERVTARARAAGMSEIQFHIALDPAILHALEPVLEAPEPDTARGGMVRLLHRENLLRSFLLELNERWIAAGRPPGALAFSTPYGPIRLEAEGRFLQVHHEEENTGVLPQETLFGLLFGMLSPQRVAVDPALYPLLAALFPRQAAVYWSADGF